MDRINKNESLLEYYKGHYDGKEKTNRLLINIINSIVANRGCEKNEKFENEILEFVDYFKINNSKFYSQNQDYPIFRVYLEILQSRLEQRHVKVASSLTHKQLLTASDFMKKIFSLHKIFIYVTCVYNQIYTENNVTNENLRRMAEYMLYSKNGIILFYFCSPKQHCFGFKLVNDEFEEIDATQLKKLSGQKDVVFTTFSKIKNEGENTVEK